MPGINILNTIVSTHADTLKSMDVAGVVSSVFVEKHANLSAQHPDLITLFSADVQP